MIIESDSMEVVELLISQDIITHHYEEVARRILDLQRHHGSLVFQHVHREGNVLANYLAKVGLNLVYGQH